MQVLGPYTAGTIRSISGSVDVTFSGGRSDARWFVEAAQYDTGGALIRYDQLSNQPLSAPHVSFSYTPDLVAARVELIAHLAAYSGQNMTSTVSGSWSAAEPCQYGTKLKDGADFVYYLTPGLIDVWLGTVDLAWLAPVFTATWFSTFDAQSLCGSGPPPMPVINLGTLEASAETIWQLLRVIAWPNVCECVPGTPTPVPYDPPSATQPTGWPSAPTFPCDPSAICSTLSSMASQLAALQKAVQTNLDLTTAVQRYAVPFAYIKGAVHSGLTGSGTIALPRLAGVLVDVTTVPSDRTVLPGQPGYVWNLGWMSVETADGMMEERRVARVSMVWHPRTMQEATTFGYYLQPGVVASVTELEAEP